MMKNKTKEKLHKSFMDKMDKYVEESEFMPIAVFIDGGEIDGVSYCGEFLKLLEEHENLLFNQGRLEVLNEIQDFIENQRDNGNMKPMGNGFSASLCISDLLKEIERLKNGN
jgi:hypothetical protein